MAGRLRLPLPHVALAVALGVASGFYIYKPYFPPRPPPAPPAPEKQP